MGILFHYYYEGGDTILYFKYAKELSHLSWSEFWPTIFGQTVSSHPVRAVYFVRMVAVVLYFTKADYWVASLYFSSASYFAVIYLMVQIAKYRSGNLRSMAFGFLLFPSVVFWSSGIMKESLAFGGLVFLISAYLKIINQQLAWYDWLGLTLSILILGLLKNYILVVAFPVFLVLIQDHYFKAHGNPLGSGLRFILVCMVALPAAYFVFIYLFPNFHWNQIFNDIEISRQNIYQNATRSLNVNSFSGEGFLSMISNFFHYLFSGLLRPQVFESWKFPVWVAAVENFVLLVLIVWKTISVRNKFEAITFEGVLVFLYIFFLAWMLAYSLPNLGTISRMKVYYMPILMFIIMKGHPLLNQLQKLKILP